jgi:hypothetical protein
MKILFVTPNTAGSGEAITARHMGTDLAKSGHDVRYFADPFTARFLEDPGRGPVIEASEPGETQARWIGVLRELRPHCVIFADYPLLRLSRRWRVLLQPDCREALDASRARVVTLDHLGMAQGPLTLSFGPPHLELALEHLPAVPAGMNVLLPCPLQSPTPDRSMRGAPFRCWDVPLRLAGERREDVRRRYLGRSGELLVFHTVSSWAVAFCRRHGLPQYRYYTRLFEQLFAPTGRPVTVASVNGGSLLSPSSIPAVRIVNLGHLGAPAYDELLLAADLVISDNRISVTLGKAVSGLVPCAALRNSYSLLEIVDRACSVVADLVLEMDRERPGSVFPFEVFPIWSKADLDTLGVFRNNLLDRCLAALELYGGEETLVEVERLLTDPAASDALRQVQQEYLAALARLPTGEEALMELL